MATQTFTVAPISTSNAEFQAWAGALSAAIPAVGFVRTSDTGQITPASASNPGSAGGYAGFEMFRFADTLQSSAPFFLKITYGRSFNDTPRIKVQIGTTTNGAGTLGGNTSDEQEVTGLFPSNSEAATTSYVCGTTNRLVIDMFAGPGSGGNNAIGLLLERTHDASGVDTAEAAYFVTFNREPAYMKTVASTGTSNAGTTTNPLRMPTIEATSGSFGTSVGLFPWLPQRGRFLPSAIGALSVFEADVSGGTTFQSTRFGTLRTYRAMGSATGHPHRSFDPAGTTTIGPAILWE